MKSRGNILFAVGIVVVLALVGLAYLFVLGPTTPEPVLPVESVVPVGPRVVRTEGAVEFRQAGGEWKAVAVGMPVASGLNLRTGEDGSAAFGDGESLQVELRPDTDVQVETLDKVRSRFIVREGLIVTDVDAADGRLVEVATEGGDAVAETRDGRMSVLADGKGGIRAAVTRGSAKVTAQGESVNLEAGFQTVVEKGKAPQTPVVLPASLLLKIKWPPKSDTSKRRHLIAGSTTPGARVRVGNTVVSADRRGRFRAIVDLAEGENEIRAYALDVTGRIERVSSPPIKLDTKAPTHNIETAPGMWKKKR